MFERDSNASGLSPLNSGVGIAGAYVQPGAQAVREPNLLERVHILEQRADSGQKMTQDVAQSFEQRLRRIEQVLGL